MNSDSKLSLRSNCLKLGDLPTESTNDYLTPIMKGIGLDLSLVSKYMPLNRYFVNITAQDMIFLIKTHYNFESVPYNEHELLMHLFINELARGVKAFHP